MRAIAIVTDSVASIPEQMLVALDIHWVPYYIHRGKEVLRDLVTIQREEFYNWLPAEKELPKTACPGPGDYLSLYESLSDQGIEEIVSIHMSSKASAAYQAAKTAQSMALERLPKLTIEVIDTLNASMCHGWIVVEAARNAITGKPITEILQRVHEMIPITHMLQTADTLKYLYLGGRIGKAKHLVGTMLNIKPLVTMENGVIVPVGTARSRKRAYQMMVEKLEAAVGYMGRINIAYVHAAAMEEAEKIKDMVEDRISCAESIFAELSPALGVHTGPGTAGLCYYPLNI